MSGAGRSWSSAFWCFKPRGRCNTPRASRPDDKKAPRKPVPGCLFDQETGLVCSSGVHGRDPGAQATHKSQRNGNTTSLTGKNTVSCRSFTYSKSQDPAHLFVRTNVNVLQLCCHWEICHSLPGTQSPPANRFSFLQERRNTPQAERPGHSRCFELPVKRRLNSRKPDSILAAILAGRSRQYPDRRRAPVRWQWP